MAMLLGVSRLCCLMFYICGIQAYVSTESIEFREPTECSSNCSFINAQGELRECNVRQIAISLPTSLSCPTLLPNQFLTNEVKDLPPRLDKDDVEGMFNQTSLNDLQVKIDIKISEPNHNRLNGVFFELKVAGNKDKIYGIQYCFLLDFNGTLKMKDIIPSYGPGGDLTLSFYPCIDASKSAYYAVVGYPLPLITKPMDDSRNNYQHAFNYFQWQVDECKNGKFCFLLSLFSPLLPFNYKTSANIILP
ncbi:uncharacterized protein LOC117119371 [Anneissia japonica]|uniref:uncharacterized protein LOC117119371 n=1 Tax=Anneissia japonica TaxID=1529436 RepID=UPI0014257979|nr:uncharacterized protein LOC117119371 [Anneissia japonica]